MKKKKEVKKPFTFLSLFENRDLMLSIPFILSLIIIVQLKYGFENIYFSIFIFFINTSLLFLHFKANNLKVENYLILLYFTANIILYFSFYALIAILHFLLYFKVKKYNKIWFLKKLDFYLAFFFK